MLKKADLYIIAAGTGSRMGGTVPKALVHITDKPCLTSTLQQAHEKFSRIFIVTNVLAAAAWTQYFKSLLEDYPEICDRVATIAISSGLGDGHATLSALKATRSARDLRGRAVQATPAAEVVVAWGDVFFQHAEIFDELLSTPMPGVGVVPAVMESSPYVALVTDQDGRCTSAEFSKYGEHREQGWHDQSIFRFKRAALESALEQLQAALWKGQRFIGHGNELSMLYVFHYLYNQGQRIDVYATEWPTLSFNTPLEVAGIQTAIDDRWIRRNRVK